MVEPKCKTAGKPAVDSTAEIEVVPERVQGEFHSATLAQSERIVEATRRSAGAQMLARTKGGLSMTLPEVVEIPGSVVGLVTTNLDPGCCWEEEERAWELPEPVEEGEAMAQRNP